MHLSVDKDSPFFHPAYRHAVVTLNGVKLNRCVEADEEIGRARVFGQYDEVSQSLPITTRRGIVRITFKAEELEAHGLLDWPTGPKIAERNLVRIKPALQGLLRQR